MSRDVCRACGRETTWNNTGVVANGGRHLAECRVCRSVLVREEVSKTELDAAYKQLFETGNYGGLASQLERVRTGESIYNPIWLALAFILERLSPGRRMAEIGGGVGIWGYFAISRKWSYTNFDISSEAIEITRSIGLNSEVFEIGTVPPLGVGSYDAIVMLDVIEHVWNVHEYLQACYRALTDGGTILIVTPNYLKRGYCDAISQPGLGSPPIHLNFFTSHSLSNIVREAGFRRVYRIPRRLYRAKLWTTSLKIALGLDPEPNLYLVAKKT